MNSRKRGLGLVELLVASSVLLLLMASLHLMLLGGMRYYKQAQTYQSVQQEAAVAMRKLVVELENSRIEAIFHSNEPVPHVIFPSADLPRPQPQGRWNDDGTGRLRWQKWVCYRLDVVTHELIRSEVVASPLPAADLPEPGDPDYPDLLTLQSGDFQVVARNIHSLHFDQDAGDPTLSVSLVSRLETASDKVTQVDFRNRVFPRNSDSI